MNNKLFFIYSVLSLFLIILAIQISDGLFGWLAFALVGMAFLLEVFSIKALFKPQVSIKEKQGMNNLIPLAVFLLVLEIGLGLFRPYLKYNQIYFAPYILKIINAVSLLIIITYLFNPCPNFLRRRFTILFLLNLLGQVLVIWASPYPQIDIWQIMQESSSNFLRGMNPYAVPVQNIYAHPEEVNFTICTKFNYWPMTLLLILPFYIVFSEVRVAMIAIEALGIMAIYRLVKKEFRGGNTARWLELILLMFLFQPRSFLVIEQSWNEPLLVGILALFLYGYYLEYRWADVFLGLFLGLKQYLVLAVIPVINLYRNNWRRYLITAFVFLLGMLPFLFWDIEAFWKSSVKLHLDLGPRFDSLTLTSFLKHAFYLDLPTWTGPALAIITAILTAFAFRKLGLAGYLKSLVLTYLVLFIFGKQSFCNYYYFLTFLQAMAIFFF